MWDWLRLRLSGDRKWERSKDLGKTAMCISGGCRNVATTEITFINVNGSAPKHYDALIRSIATFCNTDLKEFKKHQSCYTQILKEKKV